MSSTLNNNFSYPETPASANHFCFRPPSSLSLRSNGGDSGFLPSNFGSAGVSATNSRIGVSSASGNTSVGSSPIPSEQDIDQILRKAVELLNLRNQALKHASASQIDAAYGRRIPVLYDLVATNPAKINAVATGREQDYQLQPKHQLPPPVARKAQKPESYKTVMCQAWLECGTCSFGENCRFAHGEEELRPCKLPTKNPKYKTKLCDKYTMAGLCPYGDRCLFIHPESSNAPNPYIRPDRYLKMQRERTFLASMNGANLGTPQTPLSSRATNRPPPSWPLESPAFFSAHRDLDQLLKFPLFTQPLPVESSPAAALVMDKLSYTPALNDITNRAVPTIRATPGDAVPNIKTNPITYDSPDSGISNAESAAFSLPNSDALLSSDYPFQVAIHTDNLARSLACEFKVD